MRNIDSEAFYSIFFGYFPHATDQDAQLCFRLLEQYEVEIANNAVEEHRRELGAKVYRPAPDRLPQIAHDLRIAADPKVFNHTDRFFNELEEKFREVDINQQKVSAIIASMGDAELAEAKRLVLEIYADTFIAKRLANADPATSIVLRNLIAELCTGGIKRPPERFRE